MAKELLTWLQSTALQNIKYSNVVLIHNLTFFIDALSIRNISGLTRIITQASQIRTESQRKYIDWMISYEFPTFFTLVEKIRVLGGRAGANEMGLYVKRLVLYFKILLQFYNLNNYVYG